jgi:dienelactone hydrolase
MKIQCAIAAVIIAATTGFPVAAWAADPFTGESVTIQGSKGTLTGIVEAPTADGQHPGVVIVSSGGPSSETAKQMAKAFAARGIVALMYDDPSHELADERAAMQALTLRGDVQRDRVGIIALGSAAPLVVDAAKASNLVYAIAIAAANDAVPPATECRHLSQKILVIHGSNDAFSPAADKQRAQMERDAKNITVWVTPEDQVTAIGANESPLLDRVITWAAARSS